MQSYMQADQRCAAPTCSCGSCRIVLPQVAPGIVVSASRTSSQPGISNSSSKANLEPSGAATPLAAAHERSTAKTLTLRTTAISMADILDPTGGLNLHRKTKIVCTLGPSCWSEEGLATLLAAGMDVARFNFSHGTHESHQEVLDRLRKVQLSRLFPPLLGMHLMIDV